MLDGSVMEAQASVLPVQLEPEEETRAALYGLLARLFYAPPDVVLLEAIAEADELAAYAPLSVLHQAWRALQQASHVMDEGALREEFERLFIGLGIGEVVPYMSWHLTGFLMEKPLARLRDDLALLGLARREAVHEPEDHIASVLEVMRFLIAGDAETPPAALAQQQHFFAVYVESWYGLCCSQIEAAPGANYYRLVARLLRAFLDVEAQSFAIGT